MKGFSINSMKPTNEMIKMEEFSIGSIKLINEMREIKETAIGGESLKEIINLAMQLNDEGKQVFSEYELEEILAGIKNHLSVKEIEFYAINNNGKSLYDHTQMRSLRLAFENGLTVDEVSIFAKFNKDGNPVYNAGQMDVIWWSLYDEISVNDIALIIKLNDDMKPIYNASQMFEIYKGARIKLVKEIIDLYGKLNKEGQPVYNDGQMYQFRLGLIDELPIEKIMIYAQLKDGKPMFDNVGMDYVRNFVSKRNDEQIKQIKECIDKGFLYKQLEPLLRDIPAKNIRILSSFYDLGCTPTSVRILTNKNYEDLKEIKYASQCACASSINVNNIINTAFDSIEEMYKEIALLICIKSDVMNPGVNSIIHRCMKYKMPPEQIIFMANSGYLFSSEEMKIIAIGFLNGLSVQQMRDVAHRYKNSPFDNDERYFNNLINETIKEYFSAKDILDEENINLITEFEDFHERGE